MKYLLLIVAIFAINPTYAVSPKQCLEMIRLHNLWVAQKKPERAKRQLKVTRKICDKVNQNPQSKIELDDLITEEWKRS